MENKDLDHLLRKESEIIPSSGFVDSVMDALQRQISAPPPIAFPWKRALPGLLVACSALTAILVLTLRVSTHGTGPQPLPSQFVSAFAFVLQMWRTIDGSWITLTFLLSFALVKLSPLFTAGKGMVWSVSHRR
jgi:hypothetical protein